MQGWDKLVLLKQEFGNCSEAPTIPQPARSGQQAAQLAFLGYEL